jgi:hypothetical protein
MILIDDGLACQLRHTHDAVGIVHTILLDGINGGVNLSARTVEVGGMYVDAERLAAHVLGIDACRISEPVVCMDDVKVLRASHYACDD